MTKPLLVITGGAGFIGSNLADKFLKESYRVRVVDNLRTGHKEFIAHNMKNPDFEFVHLDLKEADKLALAFEGAEAVAHLAANADVKGGRDHPTVDLWENSVNTSNVLEAMRKAGVKRIMFSSTGSAYGEPEVFPTPEDAPFPIQTSMYGASKVYGEGLITAYCEAYDMQCWIFRFVSILGERYTHGVIFHLMKQLREHPTYLEFLSDGTPLKSYLYVGDCVDAIFTAYNKSHEKVNIRNLGHTEEIRVRDMAKVLLEHFGKKAGDGANGTVELRFSGTPRGWIGDSPHILLDTKRIHELGWRPTLTIPEAIRKTVDWISHNEWALGEEYFREKEIAQARAARTSDTMTASNDISSTIYEAIIPCAGAGTRMGDMVKEVPKPMIAFDGVPFLQFIILHLKQNGIRRFVIPVGYLGDVIKEHFGDGSRFGVEIVYAQSSVEVETGGSFKRALAHIKGDAFLMYYGDSYFPYDLQPIMHEFVDSGKTCMVICNRRPKLEGFDDKNNIIVDAQNNVIGYDKKNVSGKATLHDVGVLLFSKRIAEYCTPDAFKLDEHTFPLMAKDGQIIAYSTDLKSIGMGNVEKVERFKKYLLEHPGLLESVKAMEKE
jgi:UDP-glucose 4-epimerase